MVLDISHSQMALDHLPLIRGAAPRAILMEVAKGGAVKLSGGEYSRYKLVPGRCHKNKLYLETHKQAIWITHSAALLPKDFAITNAAPALRQLCLLIGVWFVFCAFA
jgi:hypothetical protein